MINQMINRQRKDKKNLGKLPEFFIDILGTYSYKTIGTYRLFLWLSNHYTLIQKLSRLPESCFCSQKIMA